MAAARWVWIEIENDRVLAYRYVDPMAGPSAKGATVSNPPTAEQIAAIVEHPDRTFRQPDQFGACVLDDAEVRALGLPDRPPWMAFFERRDDARPAAGPTPSAPWRTDPDLATRMQPEYPDDLQVVVHDGEPRRTRRSPEACWVRVTGVHSVARLPVAARDASPPLTRASAQWVERTVYRAALLNAPHALTTVRQDDELLFVFAPGLPHPLHVTPEYLAERAAWGFVPCDRCGADQGLDPPTTMARTRFPNAPAGSAPVAFTAFCPCGGTMMLLALEDAAAGATATAQVHAGAPRPWWKFW